MRSLSRVVLPDGHTPSRLINPSFASLSLAVEPRSTPNTRIKKQAFSELASACQSYAPSWIYMLTMSGFLQDGEQLFDE